MTESKVLNVSVEIKAKTYRGQYKVVDDLIAVMYAGCIPETQSLGKTPPEAAARTILTEIVLKQLGLAKTGSAATRT